MLFYNVNIIFFFLGCHLNHVMSCKDYTVGKIQYVLRSRLYFLKEGGPKNVFIFEL